MHRISCVKIFLLWSAILVFSCAWGGVVCAESTSENYVLDSAMIGPFNTPSATSTDYRSDARGVPVLYQSEGSETIVETSEESGSGGSGRRALVPSHVYANESPLTLREGQSGTLYQQFVGVRTYGTLYVPAYSMPVYGDEALFSFSLFREIFSPSQKNDFGTSRILEDSLYRIAALNNGSAVSRLDKNLTLIIENTETSFTNRSLVAYYFHPTLYVWVKIPQVVVNNHSILIQAAYATDYVLVETYTESPVLVRTKNTKNISDDEIVRHIEEEIREIQEEQEMQEKIQTEEQYGSNQIKGIPSFFAFFLEKTNGLLETMSLLQKVIFAGVVSAFLGLLLMFVLRMVHRQ